MQFTFYISFCLDNENSQLFFLGSIIFLIVRHLPRLPWLGFGHLRGNGEILFSAKGWAGEFLRARVCSLVRSEPAHEWQAANSTYQAMLQRSGSHSESSKVSASPTTKYSHKPFPFHTQQPGASTWVWFGSRSTWAFLRFQTHPGHRGLNCHFGSQQGIFSWFISGTGSALFNTISEVTSEEWQRNPQLLEVFSKCFKT